jgi:hypothetical protein
MFRHLQADLIEKYMPVLRKSPATRLDLRLYTEAVAERSHDVQFLRHWSILEMIASRHVTSTKIKIKHYDGSPVLHRDGRVRTTNPRRFINIYSTLERTPIVSAEERATAVKFTCRGLTLQRRLRAHTIFRFGTYCVRPTGSETLWRMAAFSRPTLSPSIRRNIWSH